MIIYYNSEYGLARAEQRILLPTRTSITLRKNLKNIHNAHPASNKRVTQVINELRNDQSIKLK